MSSVLVVASIALGVIGVINAVLIALACWVKPLDGEGDRWS